MGSHRAQAEAFDLAQTDPSHPLRPIWNYARSQRSRAGSIRLDHFGAIPVSQTLQLNRDVQESLLVVDVLRQLVFNRFYFFTAPHDVKQQLCNKLDIKIEPTLLDRDQKRDA